jgi:hypothetical protein
MWLVGDGDEHLPALSQGHTVAVKEAYGCELREDFETWVDAQ